MLQSARSGSRIRSHLVVAALLLMALLDVPGATVHAATTRCVNPNDGQCFPSIGRAIAASSSGDTISVAAVTLNEGDIYIDKNLTISGVDPQNKSIVQANGTTQRVFQVADNLAAVSISNLIMTNGNETKTGTPTGTPANLKGGGGGLLIGFAATVTLTNVAVKGNKERGGIGGGGIYNFGGTLTLDGCTIDSNTASTTGGGVANNGTLTVSNSTITGNTVDLNGPNLVDGGGILNIGPNLSVTNTTISGNSARNGGGIANITNSRATIIGSTITTNTAAENGGGLYNDADDSGKFPTSMTVQNSTISGNKTTAGSPNGNGGGLANLSTLRVSGSTIANNIASNGGGGLLSQGTLTITDSNLMNNHSLVSPGGAISFVGGGFGVGLGTGTITGTTIAANDAPGPGGGVLVAASANLTLTNSTISGNLTTNKPGNFNVGGGFFVTGNATLTLNYSTVAFNTAQGAGGIYNQSGTVNLLGTLLANNGPTNCGNSVSSQGFDLASDATCTSVPNGNVAIGPLANNGGATQTHALLAGSAAIDAGGSATNGCPGTDQVGTARPQGAACDIGAFELKGGPPPPPPPSPPTQTVILGNPVRSLDTRTSAQSAQGACTTPGHALGAGATFTLKVTGACTGIPDTAVGIKGSVTVVAGGAPGFVTLYPAGQPLPLASNANFTPGAVAPNSFTVGIGTGGNVTIYASAPTDVIIDIVSYYLPVGSAGPVKSTANSLPLYFHPLAAPVRLFDSRSGQSACVHPNTPLAGGNSLKIIAASACTGVPAGALAIEGNGTVVADAGGGPGFITFYPGGTTLPLASNLNYVPGQVAPNNFSVGLGGGDGSFNSYALTATDLVIDVTGYYDTNSSGGLLFHALAAPVRLLDSRPGQNACSRPGAPLPAGSSLSLSPAASSSCTGIPANAAAIVGNGTVIADTGGGAGFVTFYPGDKSLPLASNLNYVPGQVVPNAFVVGLGGDGAFKSYVSTTIDLVIDLAGYFATT